MSELDMEYLDNPPEMENCPFCCGDPTTDIYLSLDKFTIRCTGCGANVGGHNSVDLAVKAWNERAE